MVELKTKKKLIKYIRLIFENCEIQTIDIKDINYIDIDNIKKQIITFDYGHGSGAENNFCDNVEICFKINNKTRKAFERAKAYSDITHIDFVDKNDKDIISIMVPGSGDSDYTNRGQKNIVDNEFEECYKITIDKGE